MQTAEWLQSRIAPTQQALDAGDGCHADEANSLAAYLKGRLTALEAAKAFTAPVLTDAEPAATLYRPMGLLCEALVELGSQRDSLVHLVAAIQQLRPTPVIYWPDMPGFADMWSDLYRLYTHGLDPWEKEAFPPSDEWLAELRRHYKSTATVEAELYLGGLAGVTADWGLETLSFISVRRPGRQVFISSMHVWLKKAGTRLKQDLYRDAGRGPSDMATRWEGWKKDFCEASGENGFSSTEARQLAAECYELMG